MKVNFVFYAVSVILFLNDCSGCFQNDSVNNRSVTTGSSFYDECCCSVEGEVLNDVYWTDPNGEIIVGPGTDSNVYIEQQGECLGLHIKTVSKAYAGSYRCVAKYQGTVYLHTHNLDVFDQLFFYNTGMSQYLVHSNNSLLRCQAKGATPPLIRWYRGKDEPNEISNNTAKYQIMSEGLLVKNVNNDDDGIYKCSASVPSTGEELDIDIEAKVMTAPEITQLSASPESVLAAGEALMIQCTAEGFPVPVVHWKKIPEASPGENKTIRWTQDSNDTITFKSIIPEDAGTYECIAENFVGITRQQINIVVLIRPEIIDFKNRSAQEGTRIPIFCNATGLPVPNITITYEGKTLEEEREGEYDEEIPNYSIIEVDRSREGIYICNATNDVDTKSEIMYLSVLHQPYFDLLNETVWAWDGLTVKISCAHDSNPPANITWSFIPDPDSTIKKQEHDNIVLDYETSLEHTFPFSNEFAPFGKHVCKAHNLYGEVSKTYHIRQGFLPSVVENATTLAETATAASFSIETPTDYEGPDVIGFNAEYDIADNYNFTDVHPHRIWAIGTPFKLERLKPNSTYKIKFAAINLVGTGNWSEEIVFNTMDKSAPEPPIWQVNALDLSSNKVLKWAAPENNGEPIDYYALRYCPMDEYIDESLCKEHRLKATTELEVSDLQHNTTYFLEVIAHNAQGNSTPANISVTLPVEALNTPAPLLSAGALIGISIVVVLICLVLLDVLLYFWKKQGIIASCCCKKSKKRKPSPLNSRDKKGLLKDNGESGTDDTLKRPNNGHKEYEYNKTTGIITGKHSSV